MRSCERKRDRIYTCMNKNIYICIIKSTKSNEKISDNRTTTSVYVFALYTSSHSFVVTVDISINIVIVIIRDGCMHAAAPVLWWNGEKRRVQLNVKYLFSFFFLKNKNESKTFHFNWLMYIPHKLHFYILVIFYEILFYLTNFFLYWMQTILVYLTAFFVCI